MGNIHVKLYEIWTSGSGGHVILNISYLELWRPSCSVKQNHLYNFKYLCGKIRASGKNNTEI